MSVSLLFPGEAGSEFASVGTVGKDAPDRLALPILCDRMGLPAYDAGIFLSVLSRPLTDPDAVAYRREILSVFEERPDLLSELCDVFDRLTALQSDYIAGKRERRQILRAASGEGIPDAALNLLRASGLTLKRVLLLLEAAGKALSGRSGARGLIALSEALHRIVGGEDFAALVALCGRFETFSETAGTAIRLTLSPATGQIVGEMTDRSRILFVRPEPSGKRFRFVKKENPTPTPAAPIDLRLFPQSASLRSDAMIALAEQIDRIAGQLFGNFLPMGRELVFYRCALRWTSLLREGGAPICYAAIGERLAFTGLSDPLLIADGRDASHPVIPNDLSPDGRPGIAILGANGSGKTVWLRSVGLLQLFSQSGLPVPAKSATVPLYRQIFVHFSAAEKEFEPGNEAGRFEQEVREMAAIVEQIGGDALLLLNETFQTTAYAEGAEGLSPILRHLAGRGCRWMLTTHLTELPDFFAPDEVLLLRTDGSYRVLPAP